MLRLRNYCSGCGKVIESGARVAAYNPGRVMPGGGTEEYIHYHVCLACYDNARGEGEVAAIRYVERGPDGDGVYLVSAPRLASRLDDSHEDFEEFRRKMQQELLEKVWPWRLI